MPMLDRIRAALDAADTVHDLARELNDGPDSKPLNDALKAYRKAIRGLDLREFVDPAELQL